MGFILVEIQIIPEEPFVTDLVLEMFLLLKK